ncbi:MAG TPA: hypothetical protein VEY51_18050, partial [Chondromyces sp.]|nr:hypothetical protein [Chondromyces sp.]
VEQAKIMIPFGLSKRMTVTTANILSIRTLKPEEYNKNDKEAFHGIYADIEKGIPQIIIELKNPVLVRYLYGFTKQVKRIYLRMDCPEDFLRIVKAKIDK